jgi:hypothetical protein
MNESAGFTVNNRNYYADKLYQRIMLGKEMGSAKGEQVTKRYRCLFARQEDI